MAVFRSSELAALHDVSPETIRRDAMLLERNGEVLKLHGALALPHNIAEATFERRMREFAPAKLPLPVPPFRWCAMVRA